MDGVTDAAFRKLIATETDKPDVLITEFTNVEGLNSAGKNESLKRLKFSPSEHPIVAQIWGLNPENFYIAAKEIAEMGFDGIDLNMGCPQKDVTKTGACSALINNHALAKEIITATKKGAPGLPVSVKTRLGFKEIQTEEWIGFLLQQDLPALIIHGRTVKEMSDVPAHWDEIAKVVELRNKISPNTLIIGNGDVESIKQGEQYFREFGIDGIMIGRGIFKNPWLFSKNQKEKLKKEKLSLLQKHVAGYEKIWGDGRDFNALKKYFKIYISGFDGASDLRVKFMETKNYQEVEMLVKSQLQSL